MRRRNLPAVDVRNLSRVTPRYRAGNFSAKGNVAIGLKEHDREHVKVLGTKRGKRRRPYVR